MSVILSAVILAVSFIVCATILFVGLTNQRTQVVYVPATSQELMVELLKMTTKEVSGLKKKVETMVGEANQQQTDCGKGPIPPTQSSETGA